MQEFNIRDNIYFEIYNAIGKRWKKILNVRKILNDKNSPCAQCKKQYNNRRRLKFFNTTNPWIMLKLFDFGSYSSLLLVPIETTISHLFVKIHCQLLKNIFFELSEYYKQRWKSEWFLVEKMKNQRSNASLYYTKMLESKIFSRATVSINFSLSKYVSSDKKISMSWIMAANLDHSLK